MANDCLPQCIVATFVALQDGHHELQHIVLNDTTFHGIDFLHTLLDEAGNELTRVPVDEDYPFVDQELLRPEFYLDRFEHFHRLDYQGEGLLWNRSIVRLEEQEERLECALYLNRQLYSTHDQVSPHLHKRLVLVHLIRVLESV